MMRPDDRPTTPDEAAEALLEGNGRFSRDEPAHPRLGAELRASLSTSQDPFAAVLGCADSRVAPELIFDQGIGDLFVCRVAGNVVPPSIVSSMSFAVDSLGVDAIVVLGHQGCGAVAAAVQVARGRRSHDEMAVVIDEILPAVEAVLRDDPDIDDDELYRRAIDANVRRVASRLVRLSPTISAALAAGEVRVMCGRYDLDGSVTIFEPDGSVAVLDDGP
jgi:carbonic anhydrase